MPFAARLKAIGKALLPLFGVLVLLLAYVYPFMFSFGGVRCPVPSSRSSSDPLTSLPVHRSSS